MNIPSQRVDRPHEVSYPPSADKRGSTRVNYRRRPFYLGPYDSATSYVMFGLWKHRLLETGEPPSTKELRPIVQSLLAGQPLPEPVDRRKYWPLAGAIAVCGVLVSSAIFFAAQILSSARTPRVDDLVLTEVEAEIIRGYRAQNSDLWQRATDRDGSIAVLTVDFMEEGSENGLRHISGKNF